MRAFHGTANLRSILGEGLRNPFPADDRRLALYYAREAVDEVGGECAVLDVAVRDVGRLRHYAAAATEPVMADDDERDAERERAGDEHPEWLDGEYICVPPEGWEYSWRGVGSVRRDGVVPPEDISVIS